MRQIIECVPNFSEGRNLNIVNAIADAIRQTPGVTLLYVDPGKSANRTVYTFVGDAVSVVEGALNAAIVARQVIDMRQQSGIHPRMGAMDVCPFIPIANVTIEECVKISQRFAEKASELLGVPFYLYEHSQDKAHRKFLPQIRKGQYEAIPLKIRNADWKPDYGPSEFVPQWGATVTGARNFLIAYNINVLGTKEQASHIASDLRTSGRKGGKPGILPMTKGIGWYVEEYGLAQVSLNLNDYNITSVHKAFETCKQLASNIGVPVVGSELIGLIPLDAMLQAADYYCVKEALVLVDDEQKIKLVIDRLGLNSIAPFIPEKRIIEFVIAAKAS